MARLSRIVIPGVAHHVTQRVNCCTGDCCECASAGRAIVYARKGQICGIGRLAGKAGQLADVASWMMTP